jgi:hypothetical protein
MLIPYCLINKKMKKITLIITGLMLAGSVSIDAQSSEYQSIENQTRIWQGSVTYQDQEFFSPINGINGVEWASDNTHSLEFDLQYVRMISNPVGFGLKSSATIFTSGGFGVGGFAIGPVARVQFFQRSKILLYGETFYQYARDLDAGYVFELTDFGTNRFRTGLIIGASTRLSNRAGIFVRLQHLWERDLEDDFLTSDVRNRALLAGIELFTFR